MRVNFDDKSFLKDMNNIVQYSLGFLEGADAGKKVLLDSIGSSAIELLKNYIDANARMNPAMLHHVYEWEQVGSPSARLFDINYTVSNLGLSLKSSFRQSTTVKSGSKTAFYDKAKIIENGIPVTIKPKKTGVLTFDSNGEKVFTKKPVTVDTPGGAAAQGGYEKAFDSFFNNYFTQAFLKSSGVADYLKRPTLYKDNLNAGKRGGKSVGITTGYRWIANAGIR